MSSLSNIAIVRRNRINNMKLSVIIVSWNVREDLIRCLESLYKYPASDFEVIVVDNASTEGTVEAVKSEFPEVILIANSHNRGFAAAINQGIDNSQAEYILLLNPDTVVYQNSLNGLIRFMDKNKNVGVCGPQLLNGDGTIQLSARRFPTFRGALYRHTAFRYLRIFRNEYKKWLMKDFDHRIQKDVDQVMGAALMTRRSVVEQVGRMDESFFMYYEEVDLCYRIKQAGWRIVYVPEAEITHLGGRSAGQIPAAKRIMAMTSLLKFFRKHRGRFASAIFVCVFKPAIVINALVNIATGAIRYIFAVLISDPNSCKKSARRIKSSARLLSKILPA